MDISIVVPAYNEERRLTPTLQGWMAWMDGRAGSVELVVSDDGSSDGTAALVEAAGAAVQVTRRGLLLPVIRDTQAGFKGFTAGWAERVFNKATVDGFAFDVSTHLRPFHSDIWRVRKNAWRGRYS